MTLLSSDSFNPMLVRDLRQCLRSSRFTVIFLLLHTGMACFVGTGLLSAYGSDIPAIIVGTLSVGLFLFYIVMLPLSSATALSSEFLDNRIDLLKLTQMSARSLVWGKWLSLVTQGLLVIASLLPYLMLTYFFGNVSLAYVLESVVALLAFNALLVALGVALSCLNSPALRILLILPLVLFLFGVFSSGLFRFAGPGPSFFMLTASATTNLLYIVPALYVLIGLPFLFLAMEFGAYCLAPAAENHDTPQRLMVVGLLAVAAVAMGLDAWHPTLAMEGFLAVYFYLARVLVFWVMMFAAATDPSPYPHTYRPFVRFGYFGKLVGRVFLYPGWNVVHPVHPAGFGGFFHPRPGLGHATRAGRGVLVDRRDVYVPAAGAAFSPGGGVAARGPHAPRPRRALFFDHDADAARLPVHDCAVWLDGQVGDFARRLPVSPGRVAIIHLSLDGRIEPRVRLHPYCPGDQHPHHHRGLCSRPQD